MVSHPKSLERISTGIEGLDAVLQGGFVGGAAYVVNGPPGAGKTILANQFCFHQARRKRKAIYVSLLSESHDRMLAFMHSLGFYDSDVVPDWLYYMSVYRTLREEGLKGILKIVAQEIRRHKAKAVVIDGLFVIRDSAPGEQEFREFVNELQGQAAFSGATILILTNQSRSPSQPEYTMVDGWIELADEMDGPRAVRSLIVRKQRGNNYHRGRHAFRITDDGIDIFPRIEAVLKPEPLSESETAYLTAGVPELNDILGGGYPAASTTLLLGPAGAGKTTFGLHFLSCCTPERPGLLFGFYETPGRLRAKARRMGIDLDGLVERGAVEVIWQSPAENLADELGHRLLAAAGKHDPERVFIDGVTGFKSALLHEDRLPVFLNAINHELKRRGTAVVYTMEQQRLTFPTDLRIDAVSAMVDNIILLHYADRTDVLQRQISVMKVRDSDFDPRAQGFRITDRGLCFEMRRDLSGEPGGP